MNTYIAPLCFFASIILLAGCTETRANQSALGPVSATGTLIRSDISLVRRGTHLLIIKNEKMYYVESKKENLGALEGQNVYIEGIAEKNTTNNELPVLVAEKVSPIENNQKKHIWEIPALGIVISTPENWKATLQKNIASFSLPEENTPVLVIQMSSGRTLPIGNNIFIANRRGVQISDVEGKKKDIFVEGKNGIIHLHFDWNMTTISEDTEMPESQYADIIASLSFQKTTDSTITKTGTGAAMLCGGYSGILCQEGYFCNVTNAETRIGTCIKRNQKM